MAVQPAKTQISLGICPVWSESSLSAWRNLGSLATYWAHGKDSDQTGLMPRLIWVFPGRTLILLVLSCIGSYYDSNLIWLTVSRQVDELISKDHMRCKGWSVIGWCETIQESWYDMSDQVTTVIICSFNIWARPWENVSYAICKQQRHRSACAFAQSDQHLCFRYLDSVMSLVSVTKILSLLLDSVAEQASLSLTCSATPEDTFSHDEAHIYFPVFILLNFVWLCWK